MNYTNSYTLKLGSTLRPLIVELTFPPSISVNLQTGITKAELLIRRDAQKSWTVVGQATATDAKTLRYDWQANDLTATGQYLMAFKLTFTNNVVEIVPSAGYLHLVVEL